MGLKEIYLFPKPTSNNEKEIYFRRLLLTCAKIIDLSDDDNWKKDIKYHTYVESLQDQLAIIRNSPDIKIENELMEKYCDEVEWLSNNLLAPDIPKYCKKIPINNIRRSQKKEFEIEEITFPKVSTMTIASAIQSSTFSQHTKEMLETHEIIQESLTDELVILASQLKETSKSVEKAVVTRGMAMDKIEDSLDYSLNTAKEVTSSTKKQVIKRRMGSCTTLLILLIVGVMFTWMFIFIRLTTLAGYKATPKLKNTIEYNKHEEL